MSYTGTLVAKAPEDASLSLLRLGELFSQAGGRAVVELSADGVTDSTLLLPPAKGRSPPPRIGWTVFPRMMRPPGATVTPR